MKPSYTSLFLLLALSATAAAESIVTISDSPYNRYFSDAEGMHLSNGSLVLIGAFANPTELSTALPPSELQTLAQWQAFGSTEIISITLGDTVAPGKLGGDIVNDTDTAGDFADLDIYLWVFNGPTIWQSTEYGIFTAPGADPAWKFSGTGANNQSVIRIDASSLTALIGSIEGDQMRLAYIIPEPATYAAVLALGALVGVAVQRRSRSRQPARSAS